MCASATTMPIPDDLPVIVPAERFLADAEDLLRRDAPTGVAWPNNRRVAELAPYLDRLALVALNFPTFKDGRALQPGAIIAGALRFCRRVARHRPDFARSVPVSGACRLRSLEVVKPADAEAFAATLAPLQRVLSGCRCWRSDGGAPKGLPRYGGSGKQRCSRSLAHAVIDPRFSARFSSRAAAGPEACFDFR